MTGLILPPSLRPMLEQQVVVVVRQPSVFPNGKKYTAHLPIFLGYQVPHGFLPPDPEAHALMMYNLMARSVWEREVQNPIHYEGTNENYHGPDFRALLKHVSIWYSCRADAMVRYWPAIQKQCEASDIPMIPDEERYRFNRPAELH